MADANDRANPGAKKKARKTVSEAAKVPDTVPKDGPTDRVHHAGHGHVHERVRAPQRPEMEVRAEGDANKPASEIGVGHEHKHPGTEVTSGMALLAARAVYMALAENRDLQRAWQDIMHEPGPPPEFPAHVPEPVRLWVQTEWPAVEALVADSIAWALQSPALAALRDLAPRLGSCKTCWEQAFGDYVEGLNGHCGALCSASGGAVADPV